MNAIEEDELEREDAARPRGREDEACFSCVLGLARSVWGSEWDWGEQRSW